MPAQFSLATPADLDTLLVLMDEYYAYDRHPYDEATARRALEPLLANPTYGYAWLIHEDDALIGYVVLTFGYSLEFGGRDAFIDEFYLRESYRGQGIGRQAIEHVLAVCRGHDVRALHLEVEGHNRAALDFYRKVGFEPHASRLLSLIVPSEGTT